MKRAAVACILRKDKRALFIRRSARPGDAWAGHVAFPGGRQDAWDNKDDVATCMREVKEEVGIDLSRGFELVGRVDDIHMIENGKAGLSVRCFVFKSDEESVEVKADSREVAEYGWADLNCATSLSSQTELSLTITPSLLGVPSFLHSYAQALRLDKVVFPAVRLHMKDASTSDPFILWGLTLRFVHMILKVDPTLLYHDSRLLGFIRIQKRFEHAYIHDVLWTAMTGILQMGREHPSKNARLYFWLLHTGLIGVIASLWLVRSRLYFRLSCWKFFGFLSANEGPGMLYARRVVSLEQQCT